MNPFRTLFFFSFFLVVSVFSERLDPRILKDGDLIFHRSNSEQSEAIAQATGSQLTHMGIVFRSYPSPLAPAYVLEAVGPVKVTSLNSWIARGRESKVLIKRHQEADEILDSDGIKALKAEALNFVGLPYDLVFNWSDEEIYCSELAWKVYKRALGVEIAPMEILEDFDLSSPVVKKLMEERYGDEIPYEEPVISPVGIANSPELTTVFSNF